MPQTVIFQKTKSHYDDETQWNPANPGHGKDTHVFSIPRDSKFARYAVDTEVASVGSGCIVEYAPDIGSTGEQFIRVRWWYNPFGKIRYTLSVYTGDPEPVSVYYGESNWSGKTINALEQGLDVRLSGHGAIAKKLFSRIVQMSGKLIPPGFYSEPESAKAKVSRDISLGLIGTVKYAVMGGIFLLALDSGYSVSGAFNPHGMLPFDDELTIELKKA